MQYILGNTLKNSRSITRRKIPTPSTEGWSQIDGILVGKVNESWVAYNSICDHAGGTLRLDANRETATCPVHKWTLNLASARYENGCDKTPLQVVEEGSQLVVSVADETFPTVDRGGLTVAPLDFHFNAHACVSMSVGDFHLVTDPWLVGSCFATGWWHAFPPDTGAFVRLAQASMIYVSHNHPDHLHLPTLKRYVARDALFLIPDFESKSVENLLRREGFNNLLPAGFLQEVLIDTAAGRLKLILVRAGDARDDSSLLVQTGDQSAFFGVDTNMPNGWTLPRVDMLFTAFSGGASGFPVRIDNFADERKHEILFANRRSIFANHVSKLIAATRPRYVVPYAGYFTETFRDMDVKAMNKKNSPDDLIRYVTERNSSIEGINPIATPHFILSGGEAKCFAGPREPAYVVDQSYVTHDIDSFAADAAAMTPEYLVAVGHAFIDSGFTDNLSVAIVPTDDRFEPSFGAYLYLNFSESSRGFSVRPIPVGAPGSIAEEMARDSDNNIEILRIRQDSLRGVLHRGLPLEDLSIGFQTRMYRVPNVYNFKFWDFFTNQRNVRVS